MKYLFLFLITSNIFANTAPLSAVEDYIESAQKGESVPGVTCAERPKEPCLDFSHIEGWEVAELVKGKGKDKSIKLVNNEDKLKARKAKEVSAKKSKDEVQDKLKELKARDFSKVMTPEEVTEAIKTLTESIK